MKPKRFTSQHKDKIAVQYTKGASIRRLSREWKCSRPAIRSVLSEKHIPLRSPSHLHAQVQAEGAVLYLANHRIEDIAERMQCSVQTAVNLFRRMGIWGTVPSRTGGIALDLDISYIRQMVERGCTQQQIAARLNVSRSTVSNRLRGIHMTTDKMSAKTARYARPPVGDELRQKWCNRRLYFQEARYADMNIRDIADELRVSPREVVQAVQWGTRKVARQMAAESALKKVMGKSRP